jgi:hypothetical protein
MRIQRLIAYLFAAGLVWLSAGSALADDANPNALLKGKYRFSQNNTCVMVSDSVGFTQPPNLLTTGEAFPAWLYLTGVANYDGRGNFTLKDHGLFIAGPGPFPPGSRPVSTFEDNCSGTYSANRNGRFTQEGSCTATDGSYTLTGLKFEGQIGPEGSVLTLSSAEPAVQTLVGNGFITKRICGSHVTSVRIKPE